MQHIWLLVLSALRYPASLAGAWLWERSTRRFLPVKKGKLSYAVRLTLFWASMSGPMWIGDENLLFFLAAILAVFFLCYQGTRPARAVVGTTFYLLLAGLGTILDTAMNLFSPDAWMGLNAVNSFVKALAAALVYLLARRLNPKETPMELPGRLWGLCGLLSMAPLIVVLSFSLWNSFGRDLMDEGQYRIAYTVLPFVVLSALALLVALAVLSRHERLERAARLSRMRELYYEGVRSRETQVRTLRHDLRNHLSALQGLLKQGETAQAQQYLSELTDSPALHGTKRVCENELANVVLTCKIEEMERCGLVPDVLVTLQKTLPVADMDLCALLGNALDNAMEAGRTAPDRKITVRARADRGMLMLRVENGFAGELSPSGEAFATTKKDPEGHGFGIRDMQEIAGRYGGTLETKVTGSRFELVACLPFPNASSKEIGQEFKTDGR